MLIAILGGLGLFLLGMWIMTDGLRALAGSALRTLLQTAAATPARGTLWGAVMTLIVQSSSATTMTTIGLVSAGLLTFPQAIGVVFGANIGTTGTGWLVALLGVKVSLAPAAMPMLFAGALLRLMGRGRWGGAGGAIAGFSLLLLGLTVLQGGMAGLAERVQPADLPAVSGNGWWSGTAGVAMLVLVGILMTTVMQSSSASVAATISALHAGAVGPDQAAALVIGQNIGTAISSALAAVGATTAAKRTALAHVLFNVVTGGVMLALFPLVAALIVRGAATVEASILLASLHTAYNLLGVAILLPIVGRFARLAERVLPQREPELTRSLDRASLDVPGTAVEAARRTIAGALAAACGALAASLRADAPARDAVPALMSRASDALDRTRLFLSEMHAPPGTEHERAGLTSTLHALDHAARFAERAVDWTSEDRTAVVRWDEETARAASLAADALDRATTVAREVAAPRRPAEAEPGLPGKGAGGAGEGHAVFAFEGASADEIGALSRALADLRRAHRARIMAAAAHGEAGVKAADAIDRAEAVRLLDKLVYHAWRSAVHLVGTDDASAPHSHPGEAAAPHGSSVPRPDQERGAIGRTEMP